MALAAFSIQRDILPTTTPRVLKQCSRHPSQGYIVLAMKTRMICAVLLLLLAVPLWAHNGAAAIAAQVEGIVIDANLSDWPEAS